MCWVHWFHTVPKSAAPTTHRGAPRAKGKQERQEPKQNRSAKNQSKTGAPRNQSKGARKNKAKRKRAEPSTTTSAQQQTSETTSPRHTSHIAKRHIKTEVILTSWQIATNKAKSNGSFSQIRSTLTLLLYVHFHITLWELGHVNLQTCGHSQSTRNIQYKPSPRGFALIIVPQQKIQGSNDDLL